MGAATTAGAVMIGCSGRSSPEAAALGAPVATRAHPTGAGARGVGLPVPPDALGNRASADRDVSLSTCP